MSRKRKIIRPMQRIGHVMAVWYFVASTGPAKARPTHTTITFPIYTRVKVQRELNVVIKGMHHTSNFRKRELIMTNFVPVIMMQ